MKRHVLGRGRGRRGPMHGVKGSAHPRAVYGETQRAEAYRRWRGGETMIAIAAEMGCHRQTVKRWITEIEDVL